MTVHCPFDILVIGDFGQKKFRKRLEFLTSAFRYCTQPVQNTVQGATMLVLYVAITTPLIFMLQSIGEDIFGVISLIHLIIVVIVSGMRYFTLQEYSRRGMKSRTSCIDARMLDLLGVSSGQFKNSDELLSFLGNSIFLHKTIKTILEFTEPKRVMLFPFISFGYFLLLLILF